MTTNKINFKSLPSSVDYLNDAVLGLDPETKVLSRLYEGDKPLQDRVTNLEAYQVDLRETSIRLEQLADAAEAVVGGKIDKLVLTNPVSNGDLLIAKPSPNQNEPLGFNFPLTTNITLSGGIVTYTPTAQNGSMALIDISIFNTNDKYYRFARVKSTSAAFGFIQPSNFYSKVGEWELISSITSGNAAVIARLYENKASGFTPIQVDYIGAINLTAVFGAGKEPTKEQMDLILRYTGFFQSKELNLADVFKITAAPIQEAWKPLALLNGNVASGSPHIAPQYMKDSMGFVHFKGTYDSVGTGYAKHMGQVPTGYRPDRNIYFPVATNGMVGLIYIDTGGYIWMTGTDVARPLTDISSMTYQAGA